jgi:hypothetical protein
MAISDDLFLAILAMDAYSRGYHNGLNLGSSETQIGNATLLRNADDAEIFFQAPAAGRARGPVLLDL